MGTAHLGDVLRHLRRLSGGARTGSGGGDRKTAAGPPQYSVLGTEYPVRPRNRSSAANLS
jgi:hypothetical protein